NNDVYAGIQFDHSKGSDNPYIGIGISDHKHDVNDDTFRGIRIHSLAVEGKQRYGTNIITQEFSLNNNANMDGSGFRFKLHALDGRRGILPMYSGDRDYDLGGGSNYFSRGYLQEIRVNDSKFDIKSAHDTGRGLRFDVEYRDGASHMALKGLNAGNYWSNPRYYSICDENSPWHYGYISQLRGKSLGASGNEFDYAYADKIFGTVSGTSTHNSKMSIEDVDSRKAFDYFNIMKVKSFFYKNGDINE